MRYDVALSFAGEDRAVALDLATRLQRAGLRVFFDRFEELWGEDLSERLHEVYDRQCRHVVVLVSQAYLRRPWPNFERRVLVARMLREEAAFLLPLRLDDSELPGLPGVIAYKDLRHEDLSSVVASLRRRLPAGAQTAPSGLVIAPSDFLHVVVDPARPRATTFNIACLVTNDGDRERSLQHIEAVVVPAGQQPLTYQWRGCFVTFGQRAERRAMLPSSERLPLPLAAGGSRLLGLAFEGGPLPLQWAWPAGDHEVTLHAWVDARPRGDPPDLHARFGVTLSDEVAVRLLPWMDPPAGMTLLVPVAMPLPVRPG